MTNRDNKQLKVVSYNSRGFNASKKLYLDLLLNVYDIVFLQEHWLTNSQVNDLSVSYPSHLVHGVSGFSNDEVLSGRPYGGCAIFWRSSLALTPVKVDTCSRRICAILLEAKDVRLLCVCVYLPYEKANENTDEFLFQMSVIDSIISQFPDCHVIVGGDFNTDFSRQSFQSRVLKDFCVRSNLHPVCDHSKSSIDYIYNFNMTSFSVIDNVRTVV